MRYLISCCANGLQAICCDFDLVSCLRIVIRLLEGTSFSDPR